MKIRQQPKVLFEDLPLIDRHKAMESLEFFYFLRLCPDKEAIDTFIGAMRAYLNPMGFDFEYNKLPVDQVKNHRLVWSHYQWIENHKTRVIC